MRSYKDKKVLVVGLGRSGVAAAKFLVREGASVTVTDTKSEADLAKEIAQLNSAVGGAGAVQYHLGANPPELFTKHDLIVLSPGVPLDIAGLKLANEENIPIICEIELGLSKLEGKLIAVTGTNGKSTTTELVGEILKKSNKRVWVGGNLGTALMDEIDDAKSADFVVLEMSSYQLELTPSLNAYISVWLNVTPDHLDRYDSFERYVQAKANIGLNQTANAWTVFNCDDELVLREVESFKSTKVPFSISKSLSSGGWYEGSKLVIKSPAANFEVDVSRAKIKGVHNLENIAAAVLVAAICGVQKEAVIEALENFRGLPHRLQFVRELGGVSYYNDSKGTNVGAVLRSVESFDSPVVLIAGGQDKNTGYSKLNGVVKSKVRAIVAIGEAAANISKELSDVTTVVTCGSMEDAVKLAKKKSEPGDVVLLSPACSSFDMYKDYMERGDDFTRCVEKL
jgi:UDP-N-acetylmuramoylalanine--D-glutamate ligase